MTKNIVWIACLLLSVATVTIPACKSSKKNKNTNAKTSSRKVINKDSLTVAFYNVENLFDTENDPNTNDDEYSPDSKKQWTKERYQTKLAHLSKVLQGVGGGKLPHLIGVAEIENKKVLRDLINVATKGKNNYDIVHYDSPDGRGIDVALLYNIDFFEVTNSEKLPISFDFEPATTTRDALYVQAKVKGDDLHIFVNHWSSRRGGLEASQPKRMAAAAVVRQKLDVILTADADADVLLMGDFNDEPTNKSITEGLGAKHQAKGLSESDLFNMSYALDAQGLGTYNYRGNWNMLDQFIVSNGLLNHKEKVHTQPNTMQLYRQDYMMYQDKKFGPTPSRTYGGPNYYGGYSDHLPISISLYY